MKTAHKDRNILLCDGEDVFEGYCIDDDFVRADNEKLAFALCWTELPELPEFVTCPVCKGAEYERDECKYCVCRGKVIPEDATNE